MNLVVNWIEIEQNKVTVGVTDSERWKHDIEMGMSGVDAKSIGIVELEDTGLGYSTTERIYLICPPGDEHRELVISKISEVTEIAWQIKNNKLTFDSAREDFFGVKI